MKSTIKSACKQLQALLFLLSRRAPSYNRIFPDKNTPNKKTALFYVMRGYFFILYIYHIHIYKRATVKINRFTRVYNLFYPRAKLNYITLSPEGSPRALFLTLALLFKKK